MQTFIDPDDLRDAIERFGDDYEAAAEYLNDLYNPLNEDALKRAGFTREAKPFAEVVDEWLLR